MNLAELYCSQESVPHMAPRLLSTLPHTIFHFAARHEVHSSRRDLDAIFRLLKILNLYALGCDSNPPVTYSAYHIFHPSHGCLWTSVRILTLLQPPTSSDFLRESSLESAKAPNDIDLLRSIPSVNTLRGLVILGRAI